MRAHHARRAIAIAGLLVMAVFAIADVAHPQQPRSPEQRQAELQALTLSTILQGPDSGLRVEVAVRNPAGAPDAALQVEATLHRRTASRFDLQRALDQGKVGGVVARLDPVSLERVPGGATRTVELAATARQLSVDQPAQQGLYPLRIVLEQRGRAVDEVMTSVIAIPAEVDEPLRLALLVPVDHAPGLLADGRYQPRLAQALAPGAPLGRLGRELGAAPGVPLTLAPSGYLLEQVSTLASRAGGSGGRPLDREGLPPGALADQQAAGHATAFLDRLRDIAGRPEVEQVPLPYGPADLVALVRAGLTEQARRVLVEGAQVVNDLTGQPVHDEILIPPDGLDSATLETARAQGIRAVVLGERSLTHGEETRGPPTTPTPVRRLGTGEIVLVPDPFIGQLLTDPARSSRRSSHGAAEAQRLLAETAAVYFERPFATEPRGLLLATPRQWSPPEGLLPGLLTGIRSAPWLQPVDLPALQATLRPDQRLVRLVYPRENRQRELKPIYLTRLADARKAVDSLAVALPAPDEAAKGTPPGGAARLDRLLLAATAVWYRDDQLQPEGAARIALAQQEIDRIYSSVGVEEQPVTLTSIERQQVPVTITNNAKVPLRVRVRLEAQPVLFERGNTQLTVLQPGVSTTLTFVARVLTPGGTFAANVIVEDPEGARQLARGSFQVRSAAYSIVALGLTAGAAAFLLAWWIREILRRRRQPDPSGRARNVHSA